MSSKFFDNRVLLICTKELVLSRLVRRLLPRFRCNGHSFILNFHLSRIGRIENLLHSACGHPTQDTSDLILSCPATSFSRCLLFGGFFYLRSLVQTLESFPVFGPLCSSAMNKFRERGRVINNNNTNQ